MRSRPHLAAVLSLCAAVGVGGADALAAKAAPSAAATATASAAPDASAAPVSDPANLPELPRLAPITRPEPDAALVQELGDLLGELTGEDTHKREHARKALAELRELKMVDAIRQRLSDLRSSMDRKDAALVLEEARKQGRKRLSGKDDAAPPKKDRGKKKDDAKKKDGKDGKDAKDAKSAADKAKDVDDDGDWLDFLLAAPQPRRPAWRDLAQVYACSRVLAGLGTTPAVRELIQSYAYFGDLVRIDLQRLVAKLRDKAVPALIEARQHDAKTVQRWAGRQLDDLGKAIPGEAVATNDTQVLADVLRAYGRTRDVDALRVILSYGDADRVQLRQASREAIVAIGEPGLWQLRDGYLGLTGEKPPRGWDWSRIARELFALYDKARLSEVRDLMNAGVEAEKAGHHEDAVAAFDKVLARVPLYERRREMVGAYVARAKALPEERRAEAIELLRKALRLDPKAEGGKAIEAEVAYLEGAAAVARGAPDRWLFEHALELDPSHAAAQRALEALSDPAVVRERSLERYTWAGGVLAAALIAMALVWWRMGVRAARAPASSAPPGPQPSA